jgi:hypothetical protein
MITLGHFIMPRKQRLGIAARVETTPPLSAWNRREVA